jgi:hypothetical protein
MNRLLYLLGDVQTQLGILNFLLCTGIGWVCLCRFAVMSAKTTRAMYRLRYVLILVAFCASGFSGLLFGERAGVSQVLVSAAVLVYMASGVSNWRNGPPGYARHHPPEMNP